MFHQQNDSHPDRARRPAAPSARLGRLRAQLSFANVAAGLALFIALGGTATAAVALDRDSVGAPQIRQDGVRSPEIQKDAVRSPEIAPDAVRSSEIQDESIKLAHVASGTATALRGDLHVAEDDNNRLEAVPSCNADDISGCPDFLTLELGSDAGSRTVEQEPGRNWLVQAKADVLSIKAFAAVNHCGLVDTTKTGAQAILDEVRVFDVGRGHRAQRGRQEGGGQPDRRAALHIDLLGHRSRPGHPPRPEDDRAGSGRRHRTMSPVTALARHQTPVTRRAAPTKRLRPARPGTTPAAACDPPPGVG